MSMYPIALCWADPALLSLYQTTPAVGESGSHSEQGLAEQVLGLDGHNTTKVLLSNRY